MRKRSIQLLIVAAARVFERLIDAEATWENQGTVNRWDEIPGRCFVGRRAVDKLGTNRGQCACGCDGF
jgi:hypothetical protein